jgi:heat-inducible transcriptional repressor
MELTGRKRQILEEVVTRFIREAEPVSSARIASELDLEISSATIRKEMSELEEMGYLTHPHTSAGRIPTDRGYRFYVDMITREGRSPLVPGKEKLPDIRTVINKGMEIENILKQSVEMLARITNYLSMIVAPSIYQSRFKHLELLNFEEDDYLMVLITDTGRVYKRSFVMEGSYNDLDLQGAAGVLNSKLRDKSFADLASLETRELSSDTRLVLLINRILEMIRECMEESLQYNRVFVHGTSVILQQPEFIDIENIHQIINFVENEYQLMKILMDFADDRRFMVKIGAELFSPGTDKLSLIASKYSIKDNASGTIGILGPKRMDYSRVINILDLFKKNLSHVFDPGSGPGDQA